MNASVRETGFTGIFELGLPGAGEVLTTMLLSTCSTRPTNLQYAMERAVLSTTRWIYVSSLFTDTARPEHH